MSEPGQRAWWFYIEDRVAFAERVLAYTQGFDQARFVSDMLVYDATLRNLELIGEAASRIPLEVRDAHPDIPWRMVVATRNRLIHGYLGLDNETLWSLVRDDVPALLSRLQAMRRVR